MSKRYYLRFRWVAATNNDKIEIYRFARLVFRLKQSLLILKGTLNAQEFEEIVEKVRDDMYLDDLVAGGEFKN